MKRRLTTQDRLQQWGNYAVNRCYLCMQEAEDLEHLFFECKFSRSVWDKVKNRARIHNNHVTWDETVQDLVNADIGNNIGSVVKMLCFAASVYSIWHERNCIIFRDEQRESDDVVKVVFENVKLKLMSIKVKNSVAVRDVERDWGIVCKKN